VAIRFATRNVPNRPIDWQGNCRDWLRGCNFDQLTKRVREWYVFAVLAKTFNMEVDSFTN
jgi:hypothetical protein